MSALGFLLGPLGTKTTSFILLVMAFLGLFPYIYMVPKPQFLPIALGVLLSKLLVDTMGMIN